MQPIPKFGSFRSKSAAAPRVEEEPRRPERHERHKRRHGEPSNDRKHSSKERNRYEDQKQVIRDPPEYLKPSDEFPASASFVVDIRGDADNLTYGENSRSKVPAYRTRLAAALGDQNSRRRDRPMSRPLTSLSHAERIRLRVEGRQIHVAEGQDSAFHEEDFISLRRSKPTFSKGRAEDRVLGIKAWESEHKEESEDGTSPTTSEDEDVDEDSDEGKRFRAERLQLMTAIKNEPENVQAWLQYIDHHDIWPDDSTDPATLKTHDLSSSVAEVKLSVFLKAMKAVPRATQDFELLNLKMMEEAEKSLDLPQVAKKWEDVLGASDNLPQLWLAYLNFTLRYASHFQYETSLATFRNCLDAIHSRPVAKKKQERLELYVLLRLTIFMQEAGMQELAVALWQAVLERRFFSPNALRNGGKCTSLEEFWDAEHARIGEVGALGCSNTPSTSTIVMANEVIPPRALTSGKDGFSRWSEMESVSMMHYPLPGRTADASGEEDPFHVVLFSDIQPYLDSLQLNAPAELLIDAFLCFSRLPSLSQDQDVNLWRRDSFLSRNIMEGQSPVHDQCETASNSTAEMGKVSEYLSLPQLWQTTTETLFARSTDQFKSFQAYSDANFIARVLERLVVASPHNSELAEYFLAFELNACPDRARKSAKRLLKERSANLRLYNAYGLIEARVGSKASSDRVFSTAITMGATLGSAGQKDLGLLHHTWAWEALRRNERQSALARLTSNASADSARQTILLNRDAALRCGDYHLAARCASSLALLTYLITPPSTALSCALTTFEAEISLLSAGTAATAPSVECLHQSRAQLLSHHITSHFAHKPAAIRAVLQDSIRRFPANTMFLTLYADTEARFRIDDRVRQVFTEIMGNTGTERNVLHWAYAAQNEIRRAAAQGSTQHAVRGAFEAALASKEGRTSVMLWMFFFHFEHGRGEQGKAKAVFYRGLNQIPWCKEFAMLAFTHLRSVLSDAELRAVHDTMVDRGLRMRVDLDDVLQSVI